MTVPTIGVEEEYFLVDAMTRRLTPAGEHVVEKLLGEVGELVSGEFTQYQVELKTPPLDDADRLRAELARLRFAADSAAGADGVRLCAAGTPVIADGEPPPIGDHPRYHAGRDQYRTMLEDFAICSMHVHVHLPDPELAVAVANHLRPWLPLLVALSANSPFHQGKDTGYASWRAVIRSRFPCLGPPPYAESLSHHLELAAAIADSGAMLDAQTPFWDVRLNPRLPTLEIRTMDVMADVDDAVGLAVAIRALTMTATANALDGNPAPQPSSEELRAAYWRAARDGWSGRGVDALTRQVLPTSEQAVRLLDHIRPAAEQAGDMATLRALLKRLTTRGGGAELQRAAVARRGRLSDVVDDLVALTARR